jgi:hypothetical protein
MSSKSEEEDKKKWRIDRVQTLVESYVDKIELERARNKAYTDKVENGLKTWKNAILGTVAFFAPIILAFYSNDVSNGLIPPLFYVDVIIGLIAFLGFTFVMGRTHRLILDLNGYYSIASDKLADLNSLIIKETTQHIHEIDEKKIEFYWAYLAFASLAVRVYLIDIFNDISKSIIFWRDKPHWQMRWYQQTTTVKQAKNAYDVNPQSRLNVYREMYSSDVARLNTYIEEFFKFDFLNYNEKKRAIATERKTFEEVRQEIDKELGDKIQTIKNNNQKGEGKKS